MTYTTWLIVFVQRKFLPLRMSLGKQSITRLVSSVFAERIVMVTMPCCPRISTSITLASVSPNRKLFYRLYKPETAPCKNSGKRHSSFAAIILNVLYLNECNVPWQTIDLAPIVFALSYVGLSQLGQPVRPRMDVNMVKHYSRVSNLQNSLP